jgi:hypothetical protein
MNPELKPVSSETYSQPQCIQSEDDSLETMVTSGTVKKDSPREKLKAVVASLPEGIIATAEEVAL